MGSGEEASSSPKPPAMDNAELLSKFMEAQQKLIAQYELNQKHGYISADPSAARHEDFKPPPFTGSAPTESKSLRTQFPDVKSSLLLDIMRHHLAPDDLHKLDFHGRPLAAETKGKASTSSSLRYKSVFDLVVPLLTYFQVLGAFAATSGTALDVLHVMRGGMVYVSHIIDLSTRYQWEAVVRYHTRFHDARLVDMEEGDYSGWGRKDIDLMADVLVGWEVRDKGRSAAGSSGSKSDKSTSSLPITQQVCWDFNKGHCSTTPCPNGRIHKCRKCSSTEHGQHACKTK
ncbi:hypothetical protein DFP72DRAFT_867991 [Ephemerocybe angulata]|uniref:Uncharacterized protein n=1 Tax=Ephemerocybe angulata TaxID=980116 RepID=A0A8H6IJD5_9AGAR|nr:hypothetical protein DFP72DRAFT_867991 [Tulosesus angulatus]